MHIQFVVEDGAKNLQLNFYDDPQQKSDIEQLQKNNFQHFNSILLNASPIALLQSFFVCLKNNEISDQFVMQCDEKALNLFKENPQNFWQLIENVEDYSRVFFRNELRKNSQFHLANFIDDSCSDSNIQPDFVELPEHFFSVEFDVDKPCGVLIEKVSLAFRLDDKPNRKNNTKDLIENHDYIFQILNNANPESLEFFIKCLKNNSSYPKILENFVEQNPKLFLQGLKENPQNFQKVFLHLDLDARKKFKDFAIDKIDGMYLINSLSEFKKNHPKTELPAAAQLNASKLAQAPTLFAEV